jgi:hypothetical protein
MGPARQRRGWWGRPSLARRGLRSGTATDVVPLPACCQTCRTPGWRPLSAQSLACPLAYPHVCPLAAIPHDRLRAHRARLLARGPDHSPPRVCSPARSLVTNSPWMLPRPHRLHGRARCGTPVGVCRSGTAQPCQSLDLPRTMTFHVERQIAAGPATLPPAQECGAPTRTQLVPRETALTFPSRRSSPPDPLADRLGQLERHCRPETSHLRTTARAVERPRPRAPQRSKPARPSNGGWPAVSRGTVREEARRPPEATGHAAPRHPHVPTEPSLRCCGARSADQGRHPHRATITVRTPASPKPRGSRRFVGTTPSPRCHRTRTL